MHNTGMRVGRVVVVVVVAVVVYVFALPSSRFDACADGEPEHPRPARRCAQCQAVDGIDRERPKRTT